MSLPRPAEIISLIAPPCFAHLVFALVFTSPNRCEPKNRSRHTLQRAALSFFVFLGHVVFPLVFTSQTRPWTVQWSPHCMFTATADKLQDPLDTKSKHKRPQGTPQTPQETPKGQPTSPKATSFKPHRCIHLVYLTKMALAPRTQLRHPTDILGAHR